eukprot:5020870-Alexandrium_andersonii.AAC.1
MCIRDSSCSQPKPLPTATAAAAAIATATQPPQPDETARLNRGTDPKAAVEKQAAPRRKQNTQRLCTVPCPRAMICEPSEAPREAARPKATPPS